MEWKGERERKKHMERSRKTEQEETLNYISAKVKKRLDIISYHFEASNVQVTTPSIPSSPHNDTESSSLLTISGLHGKK